MLNKWKGKLLVIILLMIGASVGFRNYWRIEKYFNSLKWKDNRIVYKRYEDYFLYLDNFMPIRLDAKSVDMPGAKIKSIRGLSQLKELERLSVSSNPIPDINEVQKMKKLTVLNIAGTNVKDLSPLKNSKLEYLHIHGTPVQDITMLPPTLKRIFLDKTFSKENIAEYLKKNPTCDIVYE